MTEDELLLCIAPGEDSKHQFKVDIHNAESIAAEMVAFANAEGGIIYIGVADDWSIPGLNRIAVARCNQIISNAASHIIRSSLVVNTENVLLKNGNIVIIVTIPMGIDKPYFDKNGVIWLKVGSDKRRVNTKEEVRRFFQESAQIYADEFPTKSGIEDLNIDNLNKFLSKYYNIELSEDIDERNRLLKNLNIITSGKK